MPLQFFQEKTRLLAQGSILAGLSLDERRALGLNLQDIRQQTATPYPMGMV